MISHLCLRGDETDAEDRSESSTYNTFNKANEITGRRIVKAGSDYDGYAYTYDAVGNMTQEVISEVRPGVTNVRGFVYDVFGRLVRLIGVPVEAKETVLAQFQYIGLGFRVMWQMDEGADATLENSERYHVMFDERWRQVGTFRDQDDDPKEAFVFHAAGRGGLGAGRERRMESGGREVSEFRS